MVFKMAFDCNMNDMNPLNTIELCLLSPFPSFSHYETHSFWKYQHAVFCSKLRTSQSDNQSLGLDGGSI